MSNDRIVLGARRPLRARSGRTKLTVDLAPDDEALLRLVARDWNLPLGAMLGIAIRCFVVSGWSDRGELTAGQDGAQRIADALARWEATRDQPVLDPSVHAGERAGGGAGQ
jgi:hypothetical protein